MTAVPLKRLGDIGFRQVGKWRLEGENLVCELDQEQGSRNILYAFICGGEVLYVGKTTQTLKKRMYGYQNPGRTQTTNIKGNARIKELLGKGAEVEIYALPDNGLLHYGGFHVNLAAGLEDDIIAKLRPSWNDTGKRQGAKKPT